MRPETDVTTDVPSFITVPAAAGPVEVRASVPGSKSVTNRALVCAALADGMSALEGVAPGDDSAAMIDGLRRLDIGIDLVDSADSRFERGGEDWSSPSGSRVHVSGTGGRLPAGPRHIDARLAGTTSRFLTAVCAVGPGPYVVDGGPPLRRRPMRPLHDALTMLGAGVNRLGADALPVEVRGPASGGRVALPGDTSSQFLTSLMLIAPVLRHGVQVELTSALVSRPYVELTASVMAEFGARDVHVGQSEVTVGPGGYRPASVTVEPDASSASYPLALAAVVGGTVRVDGLADSLQGDATFADVMATMGCTVRRHKGAVELSRDPARALSGITIDMADISDLVPTVAVVAAFGKEPSTITGVGFVRRKESDRLGDLAAELARCGVAIDVSDDGLTVHPSTPHAARLSTHHDHRLAMAFGVLGAAVPGVEVEQPEVVTKSWPGFWGELTGWVTGS